MAQLRCPVCDTVYPEGRTNCRQDLARLLPEPDPEPTRCTDQPEAPETDSSIAPPACTCCGADVPNGAAACDYCGAPAAPRADTPTPTGPRTGPATRLRGPWGVLEIGTEPVSIGRQSPVAAIASAVADLDIVSRHHAEIVVRDGQTWLRDVGSANGTYVNDQRLDPHTPVAVRPGDAVRLGSSVRLELGGPHG